MGNFIYFLWYGIETNLRGLWAELGPVIVIFVLAVVYAAGRSTNKYYKDRFKSR